MKSFKSDNSEDIQKFKQIKEEILEKEAQLPRTCEYIRENLNNPFCKELQIEKENRNTDHNVLASLKLLRRHNRVTCDESIGILASVANDELFNGSCAIYKETKEFIDKDDFLRQAFDTIKEDLKSPESYDAEDILEKEAQSNEENETLIVMY